MNTKTYERMQTIRGQRLKFLQRILSFVVWLTRPTSNRLFCTSPGSPSRNDPHGDASLAAYVNSHSQGRGGGSLPVIFHHKDQTKLTSLSLKQQRSCSSRRAASARGVPNPCSSAGTLPSVNVTQLLLAPDWPVEPFVN